MARSTLDATLPVAARDGGGGGRADIVRRRMDALNLQNGRVEPLCGGVGQRTRVDALGTGNI